MNTITRPIPGPNCEQDSGLIIFRFREIFESGHPTLNANHYINTTMPPEKKRNYRQMLAGDPAALRQYYTQTQEQRDIQKQERKLKLQNDRHAQNAVAEALEQMNT